MNKAKIEEVRHALKQAHIALNQGNRLVARRWAERALKLAPDLEEPWLMMAAVSSPRASLSYLDNALRINPNSQRARQGMHWAIQRYRQPAAQTQIIQSAQQPTPQTIPPGKTRSTFFMIFLPILVIFAGLLVGANRAWLPSFTFTQEESISIDKAFEKATRTFTPTATFTATFTPTFTPTPTPTSTPTPTPTETPTPTPTPTDTPTPTQPPPPTEGPDQGFVRPDISQGQKWIDVDLSQQRTYAYEGDQLVGSFVVSTGTWRTPTVTGQFRIYAKYKSASMSGPGYYLPDVPFVMYFYKDYGIHGTYWHNNFGTPTSHGCVNLRTEDAKWLFQWASIGTVVNIHP